MDIIVPQLVSYLNEWKSTHPDKLFLMTEYGGDTISGKTIKHVETTKLVEPRETIKVWVIHGYLFVSYHRYFRLNGI